MDTNEILNRIDEGRQYGSYGEGAIGIAKRELLDLRNQYMQGDIEQEDYLKAQSSIVKHIRPFYRGMLTGGSAQATAATNAGAYDIENDYYREGQIQKAANEQVGRYLDQNEFAQIRPYFEGAEGDINGPAALANFAERLKKEPDELRKEAPKYNEQIDEVFQELAERGATPAELEHFGSLMATGDVDLYDIQNFIKGTEEYQGRQDEAFRSGLASELEGYDVDFFNKAKENIFSRYGQQGISRSSGLDFALTNLMGDIAKERGKYLAGLSAQQYGGNKASAREDYLARMGNYMNTQNYNRDINYANMNSLLGRTWNVNDYTRQMNDYINYLNANKAKKSNPYGEIFGGLVGAGIGGMTRGPMGAGAGYQIGSGAGRGMDYFAGW